MSKKILTSFLLLVLCCDCYALEFGIRSKNAINVSIHYLIANPEKLSGQLIETSGVIDLEFEETSIFTETESFNKFIARNALSLSIKPEELGISKAQVKELQGSWVTLQGKFHGYSPTLNECQKPHTTFIICRGAGFSGRIYEINYIYIEQ